MYVHTLSFFNTIAVRASYILPILKRFPWWKPRKIGGGGEGESISSRKKKPINPTTLNNPGSTLSSKLTPYNKIYFL